MITMDKAGSAKGLYRETSGIADSALFLQML